MTNKAHHNTAYKPVPQQGHHEYMKTQRTQDTWPAWITRHQAKQDRKGANEPPGSGLVKDRRDNPGPS